MISDFEKYFKSLNPFKASGFEDYVKKVNGTMSPYILEEREMHVTQMDVFSRLMADRQIFFMTEVDDLSCSVVIAQLMYLNSIDKNSDITINIASPGGVISSGMGLVDTIGLIDCDVRTVNVSMAASMGLILLVAGKKGKRVGLENARYLLHQPLISGGGISGSSDAIQIEAQQIQILKDKLFDFVGIRTGHTREELTEKARNDFWFDSNKALELGFIDEIQKPDWSKK